MMFPDQSPATTAGADRLFITKVAPSLTKENMRAHFAQFGALTDVYMPAVPGGASHKGICFVSFADPASLQVALRHSPHAILGHPVVVDVASPRGPDQGARSRPPNGLLSPPETSLETPLPEFGKGVLSSSGQSLETPSFDTSSLGMPTFSQSLGAAMTSPSMEMPTFTQSLGAPMTSPSPEMPTPTPGLEVPPSIEMPTFSPSLGAPMTSPSPEMPTPTPGLEVPPSIEMPTFSPSLGAPMTSPSPEMPTFSPSLGTPMTSPSPEIPTMSPPTLEAPMSSPSPEMSMTLPGFGSEAQVISPGLEMQMTMPGLDMSANAAAMLAARQAMATQQAMAMIATQQAMAQQQAMATAAMSMAMFNPMPAPMMPGPADLASVTDILNESLRSSSAASFAAASPPAASPPSSGTTGTPVPGRLFVTRVTPDMTKIDLQIYFQKFGALDDVFVPSGGKGIAFVSFREAVTAQEVLKTQQHMVKPGKAVLVDQAMDRPPLAGGQKGRSCFGHGAAWGSGGAPAGVSSRPKPY
eukprot:TRINITY_DN3371_c0_g1_i1.p1 TRINITY_DN3371_c0_g1~~TRINITY_DN3371_c0_g1_i1.p1  ORF type:complete len:524 (+),score=76.56 TRINITY_DN3371_c0_g1_i1:115-1686(+)